MSLEKEELDTQCPTPARINNWLDDRGDLVDSEVSHLGDCPECSALLEKLSSAPDLARLAKHQNAQKQVFEHEPEFRNVVSRLRRSVGGNTPEESTTGSPNDASTSIERQTHRAEFAQDVLSPGVIEQRLPGQRYRVQRLLASGGTSAVYLAFDSKLAQDVAIKVLWRNTNRDRQRFLREAEVLAGIESSNVVRVFDIGSLRGNAQDVEGKHEGEIAEDADENSLYIVMEFISGGTAGDLTEEIGKSISYTSLAGLLTSAANGLADAHIRGLVHRDVKPTNLLVKPKRAGLKVADFGLARLEVEDASQVTKTGDIVGTPQFMSPEQLDAASSVTASSDIYSLGATLYVLLTGRSPFRGTTAAIFRQIRDTDAVPPRVLEPQIPSDLETICMHAMQKKPSDRYGSMAALAQDLEAFAAGKPIQARPVSALTRAIRFLQSNPPFTMALGVAVSIGVILVAGSLFAVSKFQEKNHELEKALAGEKEAKTKAEESFRVSLDAADQLLISVTQDTQWLPRTPGSQEVSKRLLQRARDYLNAFVTTNNDDSKLSFQLARAHSGLAKIASKLGEPDLVRSESELALMLLDEIDKRAVDESDLAYLKADTLLSYGNYLQEAGEVENAIELLQDSLAACDQGLKASAENERIVGCKALALRGLADAEIAIGNEAASQESLKQSRELFDDLLVKNPESSEYRRDAALVDMTLATTAIDRGELTEGKEFLLAALENLDVVDSDTGGALRVQELRGVIHTNLGLAERRLGNTAAAKAAYDLAIDQHKRLIDLEPVVTTHKWNLVTATLNSGGPELDLGNLEPLVERWQSIVPVLDSLIADEPETVRYKQVKAMLHSNIAIILRDLGKLEEAIEPLKQATVILAAQSARLNNAPEAYLPVALNHFELATTLVQLERYKEAAEALDDSDAVVAQILESHPDFTPARGHLLDTMFSRFTVIDSGESLERSDSLKHAERTLDMALELSEQQPDVSNYQLKLPAAHTMRGQAHLSLGNLQLAKADAKAAAEMLSSFAKPHSPQVQLFLKEALLLHSETLAQELRQDPDPDFQNKTLSELKLLVEQAEAVGASLSELADFQELLVP